MPSRAVRTLTDPSGHRRVDIVRRVDGAYSFEEWHFSEHPDEMCWVFASRQMVTIVESPEAAEREARARVDWLTGERPV